MSVAGLCQICESETAVDGCDHCGRLVCADHYDEESGLCTVCLAELGGNPDRNGDDRGRGEERPDGVDEYRF